MSGNSIAYEPSFESPQIKKLNRKLNIDEIGHVSSLASIGEK